MTDSTFSRIVMAGLILLGFSLYIHTLHFPTQFDDLTYIEDNQLIESFGYYDDLLKPFTFAQTDEQFVVHEDYVTNFALRPVTYLTFSLNYLVGGYDPAGYRLFNIAVHIVNALLVYLVLLKLLHLSPRAPTADDFTMRFIPTAAAFLFLVHPLQTQSVVYIVQRFNSLATLFYLLAVFWHLKATDDCGRSKRWLFRSGSLAAVLCGMLSEEIVFTAPVMLLLIERLFLERSWKTAIKRVSLHLACLPVIPAMIGIMAAAQHYTGASLLGSLTLVNFRGYSPVHYAMTELSVITTYLRLLVLPYGQNVDPHYPLYTSLLQGRILVSLAVLTSLVAVAVTVYRNGRRDMRCALLLLGTLWFFVTIAVSSSIVPLPDLMAEHRVYLSSIGIYMAMVALLDLARSRWNGTAVRRGVIACTVLWLVVLCGTTYARTGVWRSRVTLWQDAVAKSPGKKRPNYNLGVELNEASRFAEAVPYLRKVIEMNNRYMNAYVSLGYAYNRLGRFNESIDINLRAINLGSEDSRIFCNLGVAYYNLGRLADAKRLIEHALLLNNNTLEARLTLANVYYQLGQHDDAAEQLEEAEAAGPPHPADMAQIEKLKGQLAAGASGRNRVMSVRNPGTASVVHRRDRGEP